MNLDPVGNDANRDGVDATSVDLAEVDRDIEADYLIANSIMRAAEARVDTDRAFAAETLWLWHVL